MDVEELKRRTAAGERFEYLLFYGHTPGREATGPWVLSQWYEAPFIVNNEEYPTAEHFMMAEKARMFGDTEIREQIRGASGPGQAKKLGRAVRGFREDLWAEARLDIVVRGNIAKFSQHEPLKRYLLATGDRVLVEASPADRIWGIGLAAGDDASRDPARWRGQNHLGFALMAARNALQ